MNVTNTMKYVGVDDTTLDLFESQYPVPDGVSYNSYIIMDEKITIMDTVDQRASEEWMKNVLDALEQQKPAYLVISHLEPDHSANILALAKKFPKMQIVGNVKTKNMLPQFFEEDLSERLISVVEGETLCIGTHTLQFFMAPMVHWPEVMVTYEQSERILFSADGFGTFGALCNHREWIEDARHYYINIVGKYGASVLNLLKKIEDLDIEKIAPLHGPVLDGDLSYYIHKYTLWASYEPEEEGIFVPYASIHGNTKKAVLQFCKELEAAGENVIPMDLTREDVSEAVEMAYRYDRMILAACTYDGTLFPPMEDFLYHLEIKAFQNRKVGLIENGSWAPAAGRKMSEHFGKMKDIEICEQVVTIKTTRKPENQEAFDLLKAQIAK